MKKFALRITLLTLLICFSALTSKAQVGYDFSQYDLGGSLTFNSFYGDTQTSKSTNSANFNFTYNQTAFLNYIFEFQVGRLMGGDSTKDYLGRQFTADYHYFAFRIQLQAGEIMDYSRSKFMNALKNFYIGGGLGMVYSNITEINRYSIQYIGFYTPGVDKASQLFFPARIGYEFKFFNKNQRPDVKIDVGYQYNIIFGDDIDGFKAGAHNDAFGQFTIGMKFSVGGVTSYRKQIPW
jgi:hypothetical protein